MKCLEERKISEAQKGKPRLNRRGIPCTWAYKIVASRRKNNSYIVSEKTRQKMKISAKARKMPPKTQEHIGKIRESNKKTWADPLLRKFHSENTKKAQSLMSPEKRKQWINNVRIASQTPENRERSRKIILKLWKSQDFIKKITDSVKKIDRNGKNNPFYGKKHTIQTRLLVSKTKKESSTTPRGVLNKAYIDGKGTLRKDQRINFSQTIEYKLFREMVFKRDNYQCVLCKSIKKLCVDHIKSYREYPKLRIDPKNGRVLCFECHKRTPNFGRKQEYAKFT